MIFTLREKMTEGADVSSSPSHIRENPRLMRLLRDLAAPLAPIPVTRLWTACT
jgi:hypothetical protein